MTSRTSRPRSGSTESLAQSELGSLRSQRDRAKGRVEALQAAIEKMSVKAPQDGIVIYRTNWRDEKKKVGDSTWFGETILAIPDLSEMRAEGFVDEADGGLVAEGQSVTLRLEARPDLDIRGEGPQGGPHRAPEVVAHAGQGLQGRGGPGEDRPDRDAARHALPRRDRDRPHAGPPARAPRGRLPA